MTSYTIKVGYNSNYNNEEVWEYLHKIGLQIADNPSLIADEAHRFDSLNKKELTEYAESFKTRKDLTIQFKTEPNEYENKEDFEPHIYMMASGGGHARLLKESVRRAYCRLVLVEMHKQQMEIDISVG